MTHDAETLTSLVAERVGDGRPLTYRVFEERAVDPRTKYKPSRDTLWKVAKGRPVKISPELVGAVAAGLGLPRLRVEAAAALQYTGFIPAVVDGVGFVREPGVEPQEGPLAREALDRWDEEERNRDSSGGNHSA